MMYGRKLELKIWGTMEGEEEVCIILFFHQSPNKDIQDMCYTTNNIFTHYHLYQNLDLFFHQPHSPLIKI